jgi:hypothetical protein
MHLGSVPVNNQLDAQLFLSYIFIPNLYMFRAPLYQSSGKSIVLIRHLVYVNYIGDRQACRFGWNTKHVENWNKYIRKKRIVRQVGGYLQEMNLYIVYSTTEFRRSLNTSSR